MTWCPWQSKLLATGGGMKEGILCVWDMNCEKIMQSAITDLQVKWWNVCILRLCSFCIAVLIWQTPPDFEGGSAVRGTAGFSLDVQLCYIQHCSVWLTQKQFVVSHSPLLSHTEVIEEEIVLKPDTSSGLTFRHLALLSIIVLAKTLNAERMLKGKKNSQSIGVRRGIRVREKTSVSGVWILGDRGTGSQLSKAASLGLLELF